MVESSLNPHGVNGGRPPACDVAIIGAGPYGLATRAGLRSSGLDVRQFGPPMSFWRERMPEGMLIRSPWVATSFAAPGTGLNLDDYERFRQLELFSCSYRSSVMPNLSDVG